MVGQDGIRYVLPLFTGTICHYTFPLESRIDDDPDNDEGHSNHVRHSAPLIPKKARRTCVINDDLPATSKMALGAHVRDPVTECLFIQWDAMTAVKTPLPIDRIKADYRGIHFFRLQSCEGAFSGERESAHQGQTHDNPS